MPSSAAQAADTWSGTWKRHEVAVGNLYLTQSGSQVSGTYDWNDGTGTVQGTVSGATFTGTFNETVYQGSFTLTLSGQSFTGTYSGTNKQSGGPISGPFTGTCTAGTCLGNGAAPPPPPSPPPPGGGSPIAQTSPKLLAAATAWGQTGTAVVLGPGGQAIVPSPPVAAKQREASVTVDDGKLAAGLVVNIGLWLTPSSKPKQLKRGDCVRAAVARAHKIKEIAGDKYVVAGLSDVDVLDAFVTFMVGCLDLVKRLEAQAGSSALAAAQPSCKVSPYPLSVGVDFAKKTISYRTVRASRSSPARLLRTSCKRAKDGKLTVRVRTRSRRTKLRKVVGPRLLVGLHRSASASAGTANVQTTFKRR
jgi:hypothetical protein